MNIKIVNSLKDIKASDWDALTSLNYPFTQHAYLHGLEQHECLEPFGWQAVYFIIEAEDIIQAAMPCYIKHNSYGELVFDHAWANAFEQYGEAYYPKLVTAIPYTPATGPRLLVNPKAANPNSLKIALIQAAQEFCQAQKMSSWHVLFIDAKLETFFLEQHMSTRHDCQFHWNNQNYASFADFLQQLSSRKRKNIKKERQLATQNKLIIKRRYADELTSEEIVRVHQLYASIFDRKYGTATLTLAFFEYLASHLGEQTLIFSAHDEQDHMVAMSLLFKSDTTLYGRVWGCDGYYDFLHFELCYYQGIDYCIEQQLMSFDPGAQGEHKISRGFLPTKTVSAHWIKHPQFNNMIERFTLHEKQLMTEHCKELSNLSPYKNA